MAGQYRDIGTLGGHASVLQEVDENPRTQVYMATHDGDNNRLPYMNRSFISFSYGGKLIEDFGFITITENNSMQRNLYADFEDNITESNVFDGQIYWSTHYNANTLELALFTDGVTERELEEFKRWFAPGIARELILSEHPNRAIMARIAEVPQYSMLPFEQKVKTKLAGRELETSTTCYKGRINLSFVMDDPFWYAKTNVLDEFLKRVEMAKFTEIPLNKTVGGIGPRTIYIPWESPTVYDSWPTGDGEFDQSIEISTYASSYAYKYALSNCFLKESYMYVFKWPTIILHPSVRTYTRKPLGQEETGYMVSYRYQVALHNSDWSNSIAQILIEKEFSKAHLTEEEAKADVIIPAGECSFIASTSFDAQSACISIAQYGVKADDNTLPATLTVLGPDEYAVAAWRDANGEISSIFDDKDAIKIMLEDGVPCLEMKSPIEDASGNPPVEDVMLLGSDQVAVLDMSSEATGSRVGSDNQAIDGAVVNQGHVAWHLLYEPGFTLTNQQALAFYYPGTAPGKPILSFKMAPSLDESHYINNPRNSFSSENAIPYNRIYIEGQEQQIFRFTTPSIWTGYNQAMWIFNHIDETMAWEDIRQALRDNVKHYAPRLYANYLIDQIKAGTQSSESDQGNTDSSNSNEENTDTVTPTTEQLNQLRDGMVNFLKDSSQEEETYYSAIFYFDSETGRAKGQFTYNRTPGQNLNNLGTLEEDVEDMVKSKYLSIIERNILTDDGFIGQHADDPRYSHILYHDSSTQLENLNLKYKYLYL